MSRRSSASRSIPMTKTAAARIQSAAARVPTGDTARTGWDRRAQSSADRRDAKATEERAGKTKP